MTIKMFSMFSGIGGFELAAKSIDKDIELMGYSEIDKYAIEVFNRHFPGVKNYGDATRIDTRELPDGFDLLVGGFPCQAFSISGRRRGFDDTRGTLFFDIARVLKDKRPRHLVLENVKGLLSHDNTKTFQTILSILSDLGYRVEWQVLNSKNYGVPQNRERIFIVGHLGGSGRRKILPLERTMSEIGSNKLRQTGVIGKDSEATRVYDIKGLSRTIKYGGGMGAKTGLYTDHKGIRRLTPTECERLQGFPDGWTDGLSDTQRYKTLGNAVTVNVVAEVLKALYKETK